MAVSIKMFPVDLQFILIYLDIFSKGDHSVKTKVFFINALEIGVARFVNS